MSPRHNVLLRDEAGVLTLLLDVLVVPAGGLQECAAHLGDFLPSVAGGQLGAQERLGVAGANSTMEQEHTNSQLRPMKIPTADSASL